MPQPTPPVISRAFARNAAAPYIQNPIPNTTVDPGRASFDLGFPPQTMTEIFAGGSPPYGQDVNGILFMVTSHIAALQAGQLYAFNQALANDMSGYAVGTILSMADGTGVWINTTSGNLTDPDGVAPVGWMPLYSRGLAPINGLTGGVVVVGPGNYRRNILVLSGTLTQNLQLVLPGGSIGQRSWLIVNTTSGAFTTTVRTQTQVGGVLIPQGGFNAPLEVFGDGNNVYPAVAPVNLPIDQNPTANTIPQRTNQGYLFATYFNQTSAIESFSMAAVYADAGDGYHRKISLANFAAQIALSQFAGAVANAQVPQSAVVQHAAAVLANAALTGVPTAPTAPASTSNTQVATTAFANPGQQQAANGYVKLPGGVTIQWGTTGTIGSGGAVFQTFPIAFSTACYSAVFTSGSGGGTAQAESWIDSPSVNGFTARNSGSVSRIFRWIAIGV